LPPGPPSFHSASPHQDVKSRWGPETAGPSSTPWKRLLGALLAFPGTQARQRQDVSARDREEPRGIPHRNLAFPYDDLVPRPPLGPGDRTIHLGEAARRLGVTRSTLQGRVKAKDPSIRGLAPLSEFNPGHRWLVSLDDVEAELRGKGLIDQQAAEVSVDAMRVEMLQGALTEEKDRRIAQLEEMLAQVRADKDARIAQLELQLEAAGQTLAAMTTRPGTALAR
jgi:hypothetical protein